MILRAKQDGNLVVFELEGHLDFETTLQFQSQCEELYTKSKEQRIVLNLEKLRFVGSSGINQFVRILKSFNQQETKPKFCKVSSEFLKVFKAYQTSRNPFEVFDDEPQAKAAFDLPPVPKKIPVKKKKEIEN